MTTSNGWTPERRAAASARMKEKKIWEKSTGPKTPAGKAAVKDNALKHGYRSEDYKELCRLLKRQMYLLKTFKSEFF